MKVRIKIDAPLVRVGDGAAYERVFRKEEEPFEVAAGEWPILEGTGLFEEVPEPIPMRPEIEAGVQFD